MTWIKTVAVDESDEVRKAVESQRELYPVEYATPVHPTPDGETAGIVAYSIGYSSRCASTAFRTSSLSSTVTVLIHVIA